jgi:hypothetical protein
MKASFVGELRPRFEYQFPRSSTPPPFCTAHVHPSLSRDLAQRGSVPCASAVVVNASSPKATASRARKMRRYIVPSVLGVAHFALATGGHDYRKS